MGTGIGSKFRGALLEIWYAQAPAFGPALSACSCPAWLTIKPVPLLPQ